MAAYILRRLALIIPTMIGILLVNFAIIQILPGGPIENLIAELQGEGSATSRFDGSATDLSGANASVGESAYRGAQGLDPDFLAKIEVQFGFARIVCADGHVGPPDLDAPGCAKEAIPSYEQFAIMVGNYLTFDFGESYRKSQTVVELIIDKLPVSLSLGFWTLLISYLISIPLGIRKAVKDGTPFDVWTSGVIIVGYAIPSFLFAIILIIFFAGGSYLDWFPLRGLSSDEDKLADMNLLQRIADYFWHLTLPILSMVIGGFATLTLLTKNSFLDEIKKQYVITARAKGVTERRVLYGHVFRNAMLIVIAGFPSAFILLFTTGSLLIETVFSLDGIGLLSYEAVLARDYPVIFGTLFIFSLIALIAQLITDITYTLIDPRIDFEARAA